jgi:parallel beta-helix repeat protein
MTIANCILRHVGTVGIDCGAEGGKYIVNRKPDIPLKQIGYHRFTHNHIHDCGESGIIGWMQTGTRIMYNRIERCNILGYKTVEEGGIKCHYFIDGLIEANILLDNDSQGIWLDNVWHGSRITRNVCANNIGGIFVELGHGTCLVDNNICAFSRQGDGIYTHDASGVTIAHNLLFGNTHFGIYMRTVSDRGTHVHADRDEVAPCLTRHNRIYNNVSIDNYRGHFCLPIDSDRDLDNLCDYNLLLNGAQWHWEGPGAHSFVINGRRDDVSYEKLSEILKNKAPGAGPIVGQPGLQPHVGLDPWRAITGRDVHSVTPTLPEGKVVNGALEKGSFTLGAHGLYLQIRQASVFGSIGGHPVDGVTRDFRGHPIDPQNVVPGPFQNLPRGEALVSLKPPSAPPAQ